MLTPLFNTRAAGLYILSFAMAIGVGTFIENDFGTSAAQKVIYRSWWFTLLLSLLSVTIIVNIFRFRMIQQKKWALLIFHSAMIIILIGAATTRYFGFEGIMQIREGSTSNSFLSSQNYLQFSATKEDQRYEFDEEVLFASLGNNNWERSYILGNEQVGVEIIKFIPNPVQILKDSPDGIATIKIVLSGASGREEYFLHQGDIQKIQNSIFNFTNTQNPEAINISFRNDSLFIKVDRVLTQMVMATQKRDTLYPITGYYPLLLRSLYSDGVSSFVFGDFKAQAKVAIESGNPKVKSESTTALQMMVSINDKRDTIMVYNGQPTTTNINGLELFVNYGAKPVALPFSLKLYDFTMERYPGTNSAASYASEVQLIDNTRNIKEDHSIYMNHILNYEGYRFFQSSFDNDEKGTYLSVNHDFLGTWISYLGYALLTIGMLMSLVSKKSRFYKVGESLEKLRVKGVATFLTIGFIGFTAIASARQVNSVSNSQNTIEAEHASNFSKLIVQDQNGRMKPLHTLSRELMRKLSRKENLNGLNADQVVLGMFANSQDWIDVNMISVGKHEKINELLGISSDMASYRSFFSEQGEYLLTTEVERAYGLQPIDRGVYEKELMKIDERVNIANMIYSGTIFKIIPIPDDPNNAWASYQISEHQNHNHGVSNALAAKFFEAYKVSLGLALASHDYTQAEKLISELAAYQKQKGGSVMPTPSRIGAEIFLNKLNLFNRLAIVYSLLGVTLLFCLFFSVFKPSANLITTYKVLFSLVVSAFILHTMGLGLRWYVSERAPWSNGYESMIYIGWTTILAGVIFARKSFGGLAATMILSATILMVAMLSYMDPEVTPLVPVLRSYWLTVHVSLEAGSYGFLMLGALMGLINLVLMIFITKQNKDKVYLKIKEMTYLSEMTLTGGLFMISIGTYLGGVWANESWGRYWGWDAKETWALVTILIYAFILHMRIIPKLQGLFIYNLATIFGLASVIMTYYGVNYYLSGLHSYATGSPAPIPYWVYLALIGVLVISVLAFWKKRLYQIST